MPSPLDWFTPGPWQDVGQQVGPAFEDPRTKAAALQFGLSLMGPRAWGQDASGAVANAVGEAGQATGRGQAIDIKQQEADSKEAQRQAQADAAASRAAANMTLAESSREKLGLARDRLSLDQERYRGAQALADRKWDGTLAILDRKIALAESEPERKAAEAEKNRALKERQLEDSERKTEILGQRADLAGQAEGRKTTIGMLRHKALMNQQFQTEEQKVKARHAAIDANAVLLPAEKAAAKASDPLPNREQWMTEQERLIDRAVPTPGAGVGTVAPPTATPTTSTSTAIPPPEQRVVGQIYPVPKGPNSPTGQMKWTGTGWVSP